MQMKFAHLLVSNEGRMNGYECAKEAGYSEDRARVTASELQSPKKYPLVVKYIGELREEYQKKYAVTFERHITELGKIRADAVLNFIYNKDEFKDYIDIVLHSRTIESVIKKLKKNIR